MTMKYYEKLIVTQRINNYMLNPGVINIGRHICQETSFLVQHKNITLERDYLMINYFKFRMCDEEFAIYDLIQTKCFLDLGTPMFGVKITADSNMNYL